MIKKLLILSVALFILSLFMACSTSTGQQFRWKYLSTANGDLPVPNSGNQQTASAIIDVDQDGDQDFMITERTEAPAVVLYRYQNGVWQRYIVEAGPLHIEAGSAVHDIDKDGDLDVVFGGDYKSNEVWWWENPNPDFEENMPWTRRAIKSFGAQKHHDQMFGDFDGDGQAELVFWNQDTLKLYLAEIPADPRNAASWEIVEIYSWSRENEPEQHGQYPGWKSSNEHEGLAKADIDGDGKMDIIGAGRWFRHEGGTLYTPQIIDEHYAFSRCAAGQLIEGGRPEVVLVVGDGRAPMFLYEWQNDQWIRTTLIDTVQDGHSLDLIDFNGDGYLDIFNAEMNLGQNPDAKCRILLGNGKGNFDVNEVMSGFGMHESRIADLDGDGDDDILGKPYNWEAPRLDIWLNEAKK